MKVKNKFPEIKVVMVSARDEEEIQGRLLKAGADSFFEKGNSPIFELQKIVTGLLTEAPGKNS